MKWPTVVAALMTFAIPAGASPLADRRLANVPDLRNIEVASAFDRLRARNLRPSIPRSLFVASNTRIRVRRQFPPARKRVPVGTAIELRDFLAIHGRPVGDAIERTVPDLRGMSARTAIASLGSAGFTYWTATLAPLLASKAAHLLDAFRVVSQRPAPGTRFVQREDIPGGYKLTPVSFAAQPSG
jgi:PASTA domain